MDQPVAIVTGAGRGIGRATAQELSRRGYRAALVARNESELNQTAKLLDNASTVISADVTRPESAQQIVRRTLDAFGRIDALINNAGAAPARTIENLTPDDWRTIVDTNLSSAVYLCNAVWPTFKAQRCGVIVNISSIASRDPFPSLGPYGAAKAALNMLGLSMSREGAAIGVSVHTVAPGAVETGMLRQILTKEQYPTEKTLAPAEVAAVVAQCVCGDLRHTSGEVIWVHKNV